MLFKLTLLSLIIKLCSAKPSYLVAENNFQKPLLERNNIINKKIWTRENLKDTQLSANGANYFVGSVSSDVDHLYQNNFDSFKNSGVDEIPFIQSYVERSKRSADFLRKRIPRKSMKSKNAIKNSLEENKLNKRKISELNPNFKIYPLKISTLLNRVKSVRTDPSITEIVNFDNNIAVNDTVTANTTDVSDNTDKSDKFDKPDKQDTSDTDKSSKNDKHDKPVNLSTDSNPHVTNMDNITHNANENEIGPKRNKKYDYEIVNSDRNDETDRNNDTDDRIDRNKKHNDNVYANPETVWHQRALAHDNDLYEVVDKEPEKNKITERGLVKVITMLTKTFKKLSKQHNDIKIIHDKLINMNEDFYKRVTDLNSKFRDFDSKYADMIQFGDKMKEFEDKLTTELDYFKSKHREMDTNIIEFENQQKKFLAQQRQFYTIQKLMISQNEKINQKQNMISKTQSEISLKQNNFARILKKAKQLVIDAKNKLNNSKPEKISTESYKETYEITTAKPQATTDIVKINLFSIPAKAKLENKDALIMQEKDYQPIDELVYKYYFNNTFIDNFMKNNILNNYPAVNSVGSSRNLKIKRAKVGTTLLLPIKKNRSKRRVVREVMSRANSSLTKVKKIKRDPFLVMATNFCNEIKQNTNEQILNWCVEKALRRLRFMDKRLFSQPTIMKAKEPLKLEKMQSTAHIQNPSNTRIIGKDPTGKGTELPDLRSTQMYPITAKRASDVFFPDNDELESKLSQYDLTPDTEGNVYYDGSLHLSDIMQHDKGKDSEGTSDIMPGLLDSNSKVELDTLAFDLQAKRRAFVKRLNENILRQYKIG